MIFIIKGFRTIVFILSVISTTSQPICLPAFFRCLSNSRTFTELQTTSFIELTRVACSDSVSHNQVQVLSIPVLLLACSQDWTCNVQMSLLSEWSLGLCEQPLYMQIYTYIQSIIALVHNLIEILVITAFFMIYKHWLPMLLHSPNGASGNDDDKCFHLFPAIRPTLSTTSPSRVSPYNNKQLIAQTLTDEIFPFLKSFYYCLCERVLQSF